MSFELRRNMESIRHSRFRGAASRPPAVESPSMKRVHKCLLKRTSRFRRTTTVLAAVLAVASLSCNAMLPCPCGLLPAIFSAAPPAPQPPTDAPSFSRASIPTDPTIYPYNHASSIIALPDSTLLVAWGAGTQELANDTRIVLSRRPSGSTTWTAPIVVADAPGRPDANPVLFRAPDGVIWLMYAEMFGATFCESIVMSQTSTDGGATWTAPRQMLTTVCTLLRNHPIVLDSGRWLLPAYVQGVYASQFWASDDSGRSWQSGEPLFTLPDNNLQPAVVQRSDGSLYALMRRAGISTFTWEAQSFDCGRTWLARPRHELPNPETGLDMNRLATGELVVAYNDSPSERTPLSIGVSLDEGRTWLPPKVIADGPPQRSYPSLVEGPDGQLHCTYSDDLEAIAVVSFNRAWLYAPN